MPLNHPASLKSDPAIRRALALWLVLGILVTAKTFVSPDAHTVFPKMAVRAHAWWSGQDLYAQYGQLGRFPYSPTFAIALTPFALPGNCAGGIAWSWISIVVYVWGLRRLVRDVLPGSWPPRREAALLVFAMLGAFRGLWNAQSNALIIGLLMLGASAVARRRWWEAACLLGGPVFIKPWAAAIALLLTALEARKVAPRLAVVLVIGAAVPFVTQRPGVVLDQYSSWFGFLAGMSNEVVASYRDTWTLLQLAGVVVPRSVYGPIQVATGGAALAWCLWLRHQGMQRRRLLTVTLSIGAAWCMVLGPAVEYNTYVVLAPMITWAVLEAFEARRGMVLAIPAFWMTMFFGAGAIERALVRLTPHALAILPVGTLLFVAWLVAIGAAADRAVTDPDWEVKRQDGCLGYELAGPGPARSDAAENS